MTPTIEDLQEQVHHLTGLLTQLRGDRPQHLAIKQALGLRPQQAAVLALMLNAKLVSCESIYANVFEHKNGDGPDLKIIRVVVSQIRHRLADLRAPGRITTYYGTGIYEMSDDLRAWLKARIELLQVAA